MEENEKGILYVQMFIGTLGLIIVGVGLLKYYETVGSVGVLALLGYPLTMMYLHYLEGKAGISNRLLWIRSILAILLLILIYVFFN
ncbi:hypothetical protein MHZ92_11050 [Sporosarcina sp. ACRSL]|uniref:hypothetical protein n=1 Tax=Sporosarcina sp. ACRSL TaxID=2918215 RepID=UPI001EF73751|nr:hypothetical protein [Sporosarcina sp. ACRSL]MCG7344677.1 hypothetical protein [Sporosarcina sp. ACRSL]